MLQAAKKIENVSFFFFTKVLWSRSLMSFEKVSLVEYA